MFWLFYPELELNSPISFEFDKSADGTAESGKLIDKILTEPNI